MRDFQRSKVYDWEDAVAQEILRADCVKKGVLTPEEAAEAPPLRFSEMSINDCREVLYKLRWQAGLEKTPKTTFREAYGRCVYYPHNNTIVMAKNGRNWWDLTHEMCHAILEKKKPTAIAHGEEFVGLLMHFVSRNHGVSMSLMVRIANAMNVKFRSFTTKDL